MSSKGNTSDLKHGLRRAGAVLNKTLGGTNQTLEEGFANYDYEDEIAEMDAQPKEPPPPNVKRKGSKIGELESGPSAFSFGK